MAGAVQGFLKIALHVIQGVKVIFGSRIVSWHWCKVKLLSLKMCGWYWTLSACIDVCWLTVLYSNSSLWLTNQFHLVFHCFLFDTWLNSGDTPVNNQEISSSPTNRQTEHNWICRKRESWKYVLKNILGSTYHTNIYGAGGLRSEFLPIFVDPG